MDDETTAEQEPVDESELYSPIAELYRDHRPRYPAELIDQAIELAGIQTMDSILEIGCGPATLTLPIAKRGFRVHGIDPSSGMLDVARDQCRGMNHATFEQVPLEAFEAADHSFDAVVAASSFHWAISEDALKKVHRLMRPGGFLVLFWNLPPEPNETVRAAVANATGRSTPFFFGGSSVDQHRQNIRDQVLSRTTATGQFTSFSHDETEASQLTGPEDYLRFVQTLSPFIRLSPERRIEFLDEARAAMRSFGDSFEVRQTCVLNVAKRIG